MTTGQPRLTDRDDYLISGPPTELLFSVVLPPELWLEIIAHIQDATTLSALIRVNRAFHDVAERGLYHIVTLGRDSVALRFCTSVSMSPHHANLVRCLHLPGIGGPVLHGHNGRLFLSTLHSLRNLEYLTLCLFDGVERSGAIGAKVFQEIVSMRFPLLRGFSTNLSVYVFPMGLTFFLEHPLLEDLDIGFSPVSHVRTDGLANFQFGSLHSMACGAWFLHDRFVVPPTLTHYHARDIDLEPGELPRIARLLGRQLVSLRVSERFAYHYEQRGGPHAVTLDTLVSLFPRLHFLQLDMHLVVVPYISKHIVNCTAERPDTVEPREPLREAHLTLAWACDRRLWSSRVDMKAAPDVWDEFLKSTAVRVLRNWDDYLERIVYRQTDAPWMSVSLREGVWPDYNQTEMQDEQWKLI